MFSNILYTLESKVIVICTLLFIRFGPFEIYRKKVQHKMQLRSIRHNGEFYCNREVLLKKFVPGEDSVMDQLFFVETKGDSFLPGRAVCSIESAAKNSGLKVQVFMRSERLNLALSNATCQVYHRYPNISFFHYDPFEEVMNSPMSSLVTKMRLSFEKNHRNYPTQFSDIMRTLLVWKYGGFYLDLDVVVLKDLSMWKNMVSIEGQTPFRSRFKNCRVRNGTQRADGLIQSGAFQFSAGHPYMGELINFMVKKYNPEKEDRIHIGPPAHWYAARSVLQQRKDISSVHSDFLTLLPDFYFSPAPWHRARQSYFHNTRPGSFYKWENLFYCAHAVHFFSAVTGSLPVTGNKEREAYPNLAEKHCPFSYYPINKF